MEHVLGIGGIFIRARDHAKLREWYRAHLGIDAGEWGKTFQCEPPKDGAEPATTVWSIFKPESAYFPQSQSVMINYRVADLDALLAKLRAEGCHVDDKVEDTDFGKFGWVTDCEGNKIELWQPKG